jgi:hypothetical protein
MASDAASFAFDPAAEASEYWRLTRRPLACLVFLLPLLAAYEFGVLLCGTGEQAVRNGADAWMRFGLEQAGVSYGPVLPVLIVLALLTWQVSGRYAWRVSWDTLTGMLAESLLFAFLLIVAGQLQSIAFDRLAGGDYVIPTASVAQGSIGGAARAVTYLGAGIYEEFLFRLCLLPAVYGLFRLMRVAPAPAAGLAVVLTSLTFAAAHHIGPTGEPLAAFPFLFRTFAGLFFSALFVLRGFGVTVGCHAAYDLLVGLLLATA